MVEGLLKLPPNTVRLKFTLAYYYLLESFLGRISAVYQANFKVKVFLSQKLNHDFVRYTTIKMDNEGKTFKELSLLHGSKPEFQTKTNKLFEKRVFLG